MPAVLDAVVDSGFLRGLLPVLNRGGQSVPPLVGGRDASPGGRGRSGRSWARAWRWPAASPCSPPPGGRSRPAARPARDRCSSSIYAAFSSVDGAQPARRRGAAGQAHLPRPPRPGDGGERDGGQRAGDRRGARPPRSLARATPTGFRRSSRRRPCSSRSRRSRRRVSTSRPTRPGTPRRPAGAVAVGRRPRRCRGLAGHGGGRPRARAARARGRLLLRGAHAVSALPGLRPRPARQRLRQPAHLGRACRTPPRASRASWPAPCPTAAARGSCSSGSSPSRRSRRWWSRRSRCCRTALAVEWFWIVYVPLGLNPISLKLFTNYALELAPSAREHPRYVSIVGAALAAPFVLSPLVGLAVDVLGFRPVFVRRCGRDRRRRGDRPGVARATGPVNPARPAVPLSLASRPTGLGQPSHWLPRPGFPLVAWGFGGGVSCGFSDSHFLQEIRGHEKPFCRRLHRVGRRPRLLGRRRDRRRQGAEGREVPRVGHELQSVGERRLRRRQGLFCCENCVAGFKGDSAKFSAKAHQQMVSTGQLVQKGCPFSGGPVKPGTQSTSATPRSASAAPTARARSRRRRPTTR